nr:MAG TPA: hypothetical protein [Caudoviricetes sp.]
MRSYKELADKYLRQRGLQVKGDGTQLLVPFYIMDICYQIYSKEVRNQAFRHEARKYLTDFAREYKAFNWDLFRCLDLDETEFVTDEMDRLGVYLHNYVEMYRMELYTSLDVYGEKARNVLSSILLCALLCQISGILWTTEYTTLPFGKGETNMHLKRMRKSLTRVMNSYERDLNVDFICNLNNGERLNKTCYVLANKAVLWLKKDESDED